MRRIYVVQTTYRICLLTKYLHVSTITDMIQGKITKTGNSYAIRVPKSYIVNNNLSLGETVSIEEPLVQQNQALDMLKRQAHEKGAIQSIADPVDWQRKQRISHDPWDQMHDTA